MDYVKTITTAGRLFLLSVAFSATYFGQSSKTTVKKKIMETPSTKSPIKAANLEIENAADRFISIFRRNLDFGSAFDEMFVSNATERMREAGFFSSFNFDEDFVRSTQIDPLEKAYKAVMSFYYLQAIYDYNKPKGSNGTDGGYPSELRTVFEESKYLRILLGEGDSEVAPVKTRDELDRFSEEFHKAAELYKKYLPSDPFGETYRQNISEGDSIVRVRYGDKEYGIARDVKVYTLERDLFAFYFVKEGNEYRVLTLGIGN